MTYLFAGHFTDLIFYHMPLGIRKEANSIPVSSFYPIFIFGNIRTWGNSGFTYHIS